jgi:hypothetical protein
MNERPIPFGLILFFMGLVQLVFNKPITRLSYEMQEKRGNNWLPYLWFRRLVIISSIMMIVGGLLIMLNLWHVK